MAEKKLNENQVEIGDKVLTINPIKMKYIKTNFYSDHMTILKVGFIKLITNYVDGEDLIKRYLQAVFDKEEISDEIMDNLDVNIISNIRQIVNKLNEIEDEIEKNE